MFIMRLFLHQCIHRHTGGLEMTLSITRLMIYIHRHIGGLETFVITAIGQLALHRHIGGLENNSCIFKRIN